MAILLLLASLWMKQQISRPIERMCQQAISVATGASHKVEKMDRVDEVGMTLRARCSAGWWTTSAARRSTCSAPATTVTTN
ncbi:hypothetical protein [Candidatus Pantoea persica]|uniref:hypothetical protein n=1 Tax=Candidatus Pantoea persica TaxID=2518128 RepID=UPI0035A929FC